MIHPRRCHRNGGFAFAVAVTPRLTITLSDDRHRALKRAAARRNTSIQRIIQESLDFLRRQDRRARGGPRPAAGERSGLTDDDAMALAVEETRAERQR